jgi:membrane protein YqaA with SNARE-associated domain
VRRSKALTGIIARRLDGNFAPAKHAGYIVGAEHILVTWGGFGLLVIAAMDSSVLSFPVLTDLLVIEVTTLRKDLMPFYAGMATLGSLIGCLSLYYLAKKGGEAWFNRKAGRLSKRIQTWVKKNTFLSIFIPAIMPPPFPFEPFVIAQGVFQVPLGTFIGAVVLGRGLRYFAEGFLAVRYGQKTVRFLHQHWIRFSIAFAILCLIMLGLHWVIMRNTGPDEIAENSPGA